MFKPTTLNTILSNSGRLISALVLTGVLTGFFVVAVSESALAQRTNRQTKDAPLVTDILAEKPTPSLGLPEKIEILNFPKMSFGEGNKYFGDITTIQYQISLLNVLVERQRKNKEIQTAMRGIGIPYKEPAPGKSTCVELPKNKLCSKFYPELYDMTIEPIATQTMDGSFQDFINERTLPNTPDIIEQAPPRAVSKTVYLWTDITCIFNTCRVVLIPANGGSRISVKEGDPIGSAYTVEAINASQVNLKDNATGEIIKLQPAPSSATGGSTSPFIAATSSGQGFAVTPVDAENVDGMIDSLKDDKEIKTVQ